MSQDITVTRINFAEHDNGPVIASMGVEGQTLVIRGIRAGSGIRIEAAADADVYLNGKNISAVAQQAAHFDAPEIQILAGECLQLSADSARMDAIDIQLRATSLTAQASQVARLAGDVLELHAKQALKEDAGGVGHTYAATGEIHYWIGLEGGTANWPHPPEHPLYGTDTLLGDDPRRIEEKDIALKGGHL